MNAPQSPDTADPGRHAYHVYHVRPKTYHVWDAAWYKTSLSDTSVFDPLIPRVPDVPGVSQRSIGRPPRTFAEPLNLLQPRPTPGSRIATYSSQIARALAIFRGFRLGSPALNLLNPFTGWGSLLASRPTSSLNPVIVEGVLP